MSMNCCRCDDDAQLFHDVERLPVDAAGRLEPDGHERLGRGVHVLHLRESPGVRVRQLRGQEATAPQRGLSPGRESRYPGNFADRR